MEQHKWQFDTTIIDGWLKLQHTIYLGRMGFVEAKHIMGHKPFQNAKLAKTLYNFAEMQIEAIARRELLKATTIDITND